MKNDNPRCDELSPQQKKALPHLISSPSIREGCRKAGISHTTFYRWLDDPAFKKELDRRSDEACLETISILKRNTAQAARCLVGLLKSRDPVLKRRVSNDILGHFLRYQDFKELEERLLRLEQLAEEKKL